MIAYKFLARGAVGPYSGFSWPTPTGSEPGKWIEAMPSLCASGIHALLPEDLPYWLHAELWRIELDGATRERRKLVAPRGRLLDRVAGWNEDVQREFGEWCAARAGVHAERSPRVAEYANDAGKEVAAGHHFFAACVDARAAEVAGGTDAYDQERAEQARWLANRLGLEPAP